MSVLGRYIKQPAEVETYSISYSDDLTSDDSLVSTTAVVTGADAALTIDFAVIIESPPDHRARVKLSGGTVGVKYKVTVTTTTADGRVMQDEFYVTIKDY